MESIFASDSVKNCPAHKGGFSDWRELEGNTIETFISLAEVDLCLSPLELCQYILA
jgi:hypothetical protein